MVISYNWLSQYLPVHVEPERLSKILTSIGLEVESMHPYNSIEGGLKGLVVGEVLTCTKHPDADKLSVTTVDVGSGEPQQIVCGASNVAASQKVIVSLPGTTIYPTTGEPFTIKKSKIRGVESNGMICAEDEIGLGTGHEGIMVLPEETIVGTPAADLFNNYSDVIYEIGLTPNRMDAMSHRGVARDVAAFLNHHDKVSKAPASLYINGFKADNHDSRIEVVIENKEDCKRYCGISISNIEVKESPQWLKDALGAIGVKSINNIVDITNYILHDTGQPLHAFDADKIRGGKVVVNNMAEGSVFKTLDDKDRKLNSTDLMISDAEGPMCIAGVYGGINSGVTASTKNIFLESAWFAPIAIRKTSMSHGLRTDAATRFEKGVDIGNTLNVLKYAAMKIKEVAGGSISSDAIDVYPKPIEKNTIGLKYHYLKKLSGKNYHGDVVKNILSSLGFEILKDNSDELLVNVPYSKPDISLQADVVEEIMRIDGLDNVEIPQVISIAPSVETAAFQARLREKVANYLTGLGFYEIFTNSITNSKYFDEETLSQTVKMINNLSSELDVMRPDMLPTGLEVVAHNRNRKNEHLKLFEFGKTYRTSGQGAYSEQKHLAFYVSGMASVASWQQKPVATDIYYLKGVVSNVLSVLGLGKMNFEERDNDWTIVAKNKSLGTIAKLSKVQLKKFDIDADVFYADLLWDEIMDTVGDKDVTYREVAKYPAVERDLAIVVDKNLQYSEVEIAIRKAKVAQLKGTKLFDIFESDKLGAGKKSLAVNFVFQEEAKTLTDAETEGFMSAIIKSLEKAVNAEVRK